MDILKNKITEELTENNVYQQISESDSAAYDLLDLHLEKENTDSFSLGFSKNIIRKIETKQQRLFNIKIYSCAFFIVLIGFPLLVNLFASEFTSILFATILKYKLISVFIIIGVILIQFGGKLITYRKDIS